MYFWGRYITTFPGKEGGIHVLAGLALSSQTVESLLSISWPAKPTGKFWQNVTSANSLQWKK